MKLIVFICLVAVTLAAPPSREFNNKDVKLLSHENENNGLGNYKYSFSQSDGTKQEQKGRLRNSHTLVVSGSFSWVAPNGHIYTVSYVADDNGYQTDMEEAPGLDPLLVGSLLG